jgi:RimJ/RimL family protein N-acetyltransferase
VPAPESFSTGRLVARRIERADQPFLAEMYRDPAVYATLGGPRDGERVVELLDRMVGHWDRCWFGTWMLRDRETSAAVGWVGLHETDTGGAGGVELLYAIASARWREGLATEAGRAALDIARDSLQLDELVCFTLVDNVASRRTMEGLGFTGNEPVERVGLPHVLMRRTLVRPREEVSERG